MQSSENYQDSPVAIEILLYVHAHLSANDATTDVWHSENKFYEINRFLRLFAYQYSAESPPIVITFSMHKR